MTQLTDWILRDAETYGTDVNYEDESMFQSWVLSEITYYDFFRKVKDIFGSDLMAAFSEDYQEFINDTVGDAFECPECLSDYSGSTGDIMFMREHDGICSECWEEDEE